MLFRRLSRSKPLKSRRFANETSRRRAVLDRGMTDAFLAEGRRQLGARECAALKASFREAGEFQSSVVGGVGRCQENPDLALGESSFHQNEAKNSIARPAREAERVKRATPEAPLDARNKIVRGFRRRLERAGEKTLGDRAFQRRAVR